MISHDRKSTVIRGGRLIKWKGRAASLSPTLMTSAAALTVMSLGIFVGPTGAVAGSCSPPTGINFICSGPGGGLGNDTPVNLNITVGGPPVTDSTVGFQSDFGVNTGLGDAVSIDVQGSGKINLNITDQAPSGDPLAVIIVTGDHAGLVIDNDTGGTNTLVLERDISTGGSGLIFTNVENAGDASFALNGAIGATTGTVDRDAVNLTQSGTGKLILTTGADSSITLYDRQKAAIDFTAEEDSAGAEITLGGSIDNNHFGGVGVVGRVSGGSLSLETTAGSTINSGYGGIMLTTDLNAEDMTVSHNGSVAVTGNDTGIYLSHGGSGNLVMTTGADSSVTTDDQGAIDIRTKAGSGSLSVTHNGQVYSGDGTGLYISHAGSGALTLTNSAGSSITGINNGVRISNSEDSGQMNLSFAGDVTAGQMNLIQHRGSDDLTATFGSDTADRMQVSGTRLQLQSYSGSTNTNLVIRGNVDITGSYGTVIEHHGSGALTASIARGSKFTIHENALDAPLAASRVVIKTSVDAGSRLAAGALGMDVAHSGDILDNRGHNGLELWHEGAGGLRLTVGEGEGALPVITGGEDGILVYMGKNSGAGTIDINARVTGGRLGEYAGSYSTDGVSIQSHADGPLRVTTSAASEITGYETGVYINRSKKNGEDDVVGDSNISLSGTISSQKENLGVGIHIDNDASGDLDLTIGKGDGTRVSGQYIGAIIRNSDSTGAATVDINAEITAGSSQNGVTRGVHLGRVSELVEI